MGGSETSQKRAETLLVSVSDFCEHQRLSGLRLHSTEKHIAARRLRGYTTRRESEALLARLDGPGSARAEPFVASALCAALRRLQPDDSIAGSSGFFFRPYPKMLPKLRYDADGLIPAIVQDAASGRVLMMAWMNESALKMTLETGLMHYWSRSRQKFWLKGETSGHTQRALRWAVDCDADTLLFEVEQIGGACHTGYASCFFQRFASDGTPLQTIEQPVFDPAETYRA